VWRQKLPLVFDKWKRQRGKFSMKKSNRIIFAIPSTKPKMLSVPFGQALAKLRGVTWYQPSGLVIPNFVSASTNMARLDSCDSKLYLRLLAEVDGFGWERKKKKKKKKTDMIK
jgi:hypothetical protein